MYFGEINDLYDKDSQNFEDRYKRASNKNQWEQIDFWKPIQDLLDKWSGGGITVTPGGYVSSISGVLQDTILPLS